MKKVILKFLALSSACVMAFGSVAYAKNNTDVEFKNFTVSASSYNNKLGYRVKEDSSPIFLYIKQATNNRNSYVYTKAYGPNDVNRTCDANGKTCECVKTNVGTKYSVRTAIYEKGGRKGTLAFKSANYLESQTISGYWSVDSSRVFTYADK